MDEELQQSLNDMFREVYGDILRDMLFGMDDHAKHVGLHRALLGERPNKLVLKFEDVTATLP